MKTVAVFLLTLFLVCSANPSNGNFFQTLHERPAVTTASGTVIRLVNVPSLHVRQFLGIPYAQPPVGDSVAHRILDATRLAPACPQYESATKTVYNTIFRESVINGPTSEDCLYLAVWAPLRPSDHLLPVFIFIYGGGFTTGGLDDKNLGILDQRLAIQWVRDNIAASGGDPDQIILWGQSSGSVSVDIHNFAYPDDPIVAGFISDSDYTQTNFTFVAEHFNCTSTASGRLGCMRNISSTDIEAYLKSYSDTGTTPSLTFEVIVDDAVFFSNYTDRYLAGNMSDRPAIFGTNRNEDTSLVSLPTDPAINALNETLVISNTLSKALCNFTNVSPYDWLASYHSSEFYQIFGTAPDFGGPNTSFENEVSATVQDLWLAFAQDPYDALPSFGWSEYSDGYINVLANQTNNGTGIIMQLVNSDDIDDQCSESALITEASY
ncbi:chlorogenic acid esterase precursor [Lentinula aciculospora]|uniref:Chlorogenic acid esterase n=1 Tax=Lentinula aciculospora TaxID=153920 RepID=A0A9W9A675_9AGAR|nr:chlorogenic acid esterase precursor [Lentinula aciculospora]